MRTKNLILIAAVFFTCTANAQRERGGFNPDKWAKPHAQLEKPKESSLSEQEKKDIEEFLKGSKKCTWEINQPRKVSVTGCDTANNKLCLGSIKCEHEKGLVRFESVYCTSKFCGDANECLRDHSVNTVMVDSQGERTYKDTGRERGTR